MIDRRLIMNINWLFMFVLFLLIGIGVMNIYSAGMQQVDGVLSQAPFFKRQLVFAGIGFIIMIIVMIVGYKMLGKSWWVLYIVTTLSLLYVKFFGVLINGSRRWINLGPVNFQPSELAKICVIVITARILAKTETRINWKTFFILLFVSTIPAILILKQPDLGSALSLFLIQAGIMFFFGFEPKVLVTILGALPFLFTGAWFWMHDYQRQRILTFLHPEKNLHSTGWHVIQSQIAVGSGQFWGQGFLGGSQNQLRFLPEAHTDFAFAVIGEEWGFFGSIIALLICCLFLYLICETVNNARDNFAKYLCVGIFFYFFWQIFINLGMVLGWMPVVGIPFPFISYGGSSLVMNMILAGLVLSVSMRRFIFQNKSFF